MKKIWAMPHCMPLPPWFRSCIYSLVLAPCSLGFVDDLGPTSLVGLLWWPQILWLPLVTVPTLYCSPSWGGMCLHPCWWQHGGVTLVALLPPFAEHVPQPHLRLVNLLFHPQVNQCFQFCFNYFLYFLLFERDFFFFLCSRNLRRSCLLFIY